MYRRIGLLQFLGEDYRAWVESLEAIGPVPGCFALPPPDSARRLLDHLGLDAEDREAVVNALPTLTNEPELWWLLERAYHSLLVEIGRNDAIYGRSPMLPDRLGVQGRCFWVFVFLAVVPDIRRWHLERGVPDDVSWETLADLGRHMWLYRRRTGSAGLDTPWWIGLHFRGALFALGRLQFNPYQLRTGPAGPLFWYDASAVEALGDEFRPGAPVLGAHIPESGPLDPRSVDESLRMAGGFFDTHFPERASRIVTCTSWLLDDQLLNYLPESSNIVQFQRRFTLLPGALDSDNSTLQFVLGRVPIALSELQPRTTLERALVKHIAEGGHWRNRTGWLRLPDA